MDPKLPKPRPEVDAPMRLAAFAVPLVPLLFLAFAPSVPTPVVLALSSPAVDRATPAADTVLLVVAEEGNRARYRVREQLARLDFPNDAVGETSTVSGSLMVTPEGEIVRAGSRFVIRLADLASDADRRDNYLRRNTLGTEEYPDAVFIPTGFRDLPSPLPATGEASFLLEGELTIRDVTRPVSWQVDAEFSNGAVLGRAETRFTFADMGLTVPTVGSVLSIRDDIRLEYDFRLVPAGSQP
jgi:polyisoprenoid-binding protein YceI